MRISCVIYRGRTSLLAQMLKRLSTMRETRVQSLGWEDLLEKEMATHSSILAWKIPWTEEPGRLQSMGLQRVRHDWANSLSLSLSYRGRHCKQHWEHWSIHLFPRYNPSNRNRKAMTNKNNETLACAMENKKSWRSKILHSPTCLSLNYVYFSVQ